MRYTPVMSAADLSLVREYRRRAEQALPGRIVLIMRYGSRARGDARPDSDWDIAVFVGGEPTPIDRRALSDIGFDLMIEQGQHVHAFAIDAASTPHDSYFVKNVMKDGLAA